MVREESYLFDNDKKANILIPCLEGVEIIGSSSDHLILDIEDSIENMKLGGGIDFYMIYQPMLYLSSFTSATKVFV